jgi:hypothetical protein
MKINLAIVGSRDLNDYKLLKAETDSYIVEIQKLFPENQLEVVIISGGARGADTLAEKYAIDNKYQTVIYRVTSNQWKELGKVAGILRNTDIVKASDYMIAFPSQTSRGTFDSINKMLKKNGNVKIIKYDLL